jgi:hypothetical protein
MFSAIFNPLELGYLLIPPISLASICGKRKRRSDITYP